MSQTHETKKRRRSGDLAPRPEIWNALDQGAMLRPLLTAFYKKIYASLRFQPFFEGVTMEHVISKQHSYLMSVFTGERVYFGQRMRNAHHWMVISDELFDEREAMFEETLYEFDLPEPIVEDWLSIHQLFRKQIVKAKAVPKKIAGVSLPLEGYEKLVLECGGVCDGCFDAIETGTTISFHVRTGKAYCEKCGSERIGLGPDTLAAPIHEKLVEIVKAVHGLDIREFEDSESDLYPTLIPRTITLLDEAAGVVGEVLSFLKTQSLDETLVTGTSEQVAPRNFEFDIDTLMQSTTVGSSHQEHLEQLAMITATTNRELQERKCRITGLGANESAWQRIAECDSALRRISKSLTAIEFSLCRAERLSRLLVFQTELEISLAIRRMYVRFRREIVGSTSPSKLDIKERLQAVSEQISVFVKQDIYPLLRVRDRSQLRGIQAQILDWNGGESRDDSAGILLLKNLAETTGMFCLISKREEIVAHDSEQIAYIFGTIFTSHQALSEDIVSVLRSIEGIDPEIDALIRDEFWESPAPWRPAIIRLMTYFGQAESSLVKLENLKLDISDFF